MSLRHTIEVVTKLARQGTIEHYAIAGAVRSSGSNLGALSSATILASNGKAAIASMPMVSGV
jgi:hypothetical protein